MPTIRKIFLESAVVFCLVNPTVYSQAKSLVFPHPKLEVEGGGDFDFGNIYRGQRVTHVFTIKNDGSDTLIINNVSSTCGCTAAITSTKRVPPLSHSELTVTFNSEGYGGRVYKPVTISSNDPVIPNLQVSITANVLPVLELNPAFVYIQRAKVDSVSKATIEVQNATSEPLKILSVEPRLRGLQVELGKKNLKPGEKTSLKTSFKPGQNQDGIVSSNVELKTDFKPQPVVVFRYTANVFK